MPTFLDLNYSLYEDDSIDVMLIKYKKNLGYLDYLPKSMNVFFLGLSHRNNIKLKDNICYCLYRKSKILGVLKIRFHKKIKTLNPDYILIHGLGFGLYSFFLRLALPTKTKIFVQAHGHVQPPRGLKAKIYGLSSRFINGYFFTGKDNARGWGNATNISSNKIFELMEGGANFIYHPEKDRVKFSYLWVARLNSNKDPLLVLNGFNKLIEIEPRATLTMYYSTTELLDEVSRFLDSNLDLKSKVFLKGKVENETLLKEYKKYQFFIQASHYEGSGYALLEAMSNGCLPIVSKIPSFDFMLENTVPELRFDVKDSSQFLEALKNSLTIDSKKSQEDIVSIFNKKLSFKAIANQITDAFNQVK